MGDMGEIFNAMREHNKEVRANRKLKYCGRLVAIGAEPKANGVWQYKEWLLYPTKGFAMSRYNTKQRISLDKLLKESEE